MTRKKHRKFHLWHFDPSIFQPGPRASFLQRRVLVPARSFAKSLLFALAFVYPLLLVITGVIFGGLVFWASFVGSMGLIGLIIMKTGYSRNFASWDVGYKRFVGLFVGGGAVLAVFYGILYTPLRLLTVPLVAGILVLFVVVGSLKNSAR